MIEYIEVTNEAGSTLRLPLSNPWETGMAVTNITGINTVKANINMTGYADSDLKKKNYAALDTRNIVITLRYLATSTKTVEEVRDDAYFFFTPKKKIHLVIKTDRRFVGTDGYVESNEPDIFSKEEASTISILCEDPLLYDENGEDIDRSDYNFNAVEPMLEFQLCNDSLTEKLIELGEVRHKPINSIVYEGEYDVGFTIHMHCKGKVTDPVIYSNRQGGEFKLITSRLANILASGSTTFEKGDVITISTIPGHKSIMLLRNGKVYNILHLLLAGSTWPMLKTGTNEFIVDAANGFEMIAISYSYSLGYLGV